MTVRFPNDRPPMLSVVIPVHAVEPFLFQCLHSVLAEAGADVEIVAVDDASPDGCPAMLDAVASHDPRVTVVHLDTNVGLGPARNTGLDRARGQYVWFVDSDDSLPAGSVPAVLAALRAHHPDVLLLDHVRVHDDDGRVEPDPSSPLLRGVTTVGPLAARPDLLGVQHAAWNKVIRRRFLIELGLRFAAGWYEDCSFSHPLLIAADTIATLDRVAYHYRQRSTGAITRTVSDRHFEVFDQYELLWARLDQLVVRENAVRAHVFRMMIDHLLVIAGNAHRLPPARRGEFFRRAAELYRRFRPATGYQRPGGAPGLKHRVLAGDWYWAYAALRLAYRMPTRLRPPAGPAPSGASVPWADAPGQPHDLPKHVRPVGSGG